MSDNQKRPGDSEKALDLVTGLRDLAHDSDTLAQDEPLDYDYPGMRLQFLGTAQALRMAADEIERMRIELGAIDELTVADRPYDWRLDQIRTIASAPRNKIQRLVPVSDSLEETQ